MTCPKWVGDLNRHKNLYYKLYHNGYKAKAIRKMVTDDMVKAARREMEKEVASRKKERDKRILHRTAVNMRDDHWPLNVILANFGEDVFDKEK